MDYAGGPRALPRGWGRPLLGPMLLHLPSSHQSLDPFSATRVVDRSGLFCCRCGDPQHFIDRCPMSLVDLRCNQTKIHQSLIQSEALDTRRVLQVRCVHRDVVKYPLMSAVFQFRGQKHNVAVNPHLHHPLILGTNWPAFSELLGNLCTDVSCGKKKQERGVTV